MKKLICILFTLFVFVVGYSQKVYFVYFQSESGKPFSVVINDKSHHSSQAGYLIISKLQSNAYNISVKINNSNLAEQYFTLPTIDKDYGFLIQELNGGEELALKNYQTTQLLTAKKNIEDGQKVVKKEVSIFTNVLSKAENDPTLKEAIIETRPQETIPAETTKVVEGKGKSKIKTAETAVNAAKEQKEADSIRTPKLPEDEDKFTDVRGTTVKLSKEEVEKYNLPVEAKIKRPAAPKYQPSVVKKTSETATNEGVLIEYTDTYADGTEDEINILIPVKKPVKPVEVKVKEAVVDDKKFIEGENLIKVESVKKQPEEKPKKASVKKDNTNKETAIPAVSKAKEKVTEEAATENKNCKAIANESDFLKLRKRMVYQNSEAEMVAEAAKVFKTKCFTTKQVKNISGLFLNDDTKYKFFDAAYAHISDLENFKSMDCGIKDPYYLNRFKALVGQ